ncbi:hypothetical protein EJ08DRAFT_315950 [Tothia fuscella]|uniref:Uncharacterized protein n=1 Tax=Tothia fuscella TaxID=1048955 RepID=A0A9P4NNZ6_9PEZI|nr:hypothetical protein EJ08DRAFT_315950 [Tothia fuscella]
MCIMTLLMVIMRSTSGLRLQVGWVLLLLLYTHLYKPPFSPFLSFVLLSLVVRDLLYNYLSSIHGVYDVVVFGREYGLEGEVQFDF